MFIAVRSKRGVALLERALIAAPDSEEFVFHVKHTPVEQSAAACRSFLDESMDPGIDHLDRQDFGDLGDARDALTRKVRACALPAVLDARNQLAASCLDTSNDS